MRLTISRASSSVGARKKIQVKVTKPKTSACFEQPGNALLVEFGGLDFAGQAAAQSVERAPNDISPAGAVPDAGDDHGDEHVAIGLKSAAAAAAQRKYK